MHNKFVQLTSMILSALGSNTETFCANSYAPGHSKEYGKWTLTLHTCIAFKRRTLE